MSDAGDLLARWREENVEYDFFTRDWTGENLAFELKSHPPLARLGSFRDGWFYVQDPSTLLAPRLLDAQPGETVLDLCAAPGGKTTFLAQLMDNQGRIIASDLDPNRLKLVRDNCARLGVTCVESCLLLRPVCTASARINHLQPHPGGRAVFQHRRAAPARGFALADSTDGNRTSPGRATGFARAGGGAAGARRRAGL